MGTGLWAVGGAPRDLILGRPVNDLDLAIDSDVGRFVRALSHVLPEASAGSATAFGTASVSLPASIVPARLDLARLRTERYLQPGALPKVRWTRSIERDLARRDFSVNAIALGLVGTDRGRVIDPYEGVANARAGTLRVLHPRSFQDDATRLWRGARLAAAFGLRPDAETAQLIEQAPKWVAAISGDRWSGELDFTARRGGSGPVIRFLDQWGVLRAIHAEWSVEARTAGALARHRRSMSAERLAAVLLAPLPARAAILQRLQASGGMRDAVEDAARVLAMAEPPTIEGLVALERSGEDAREAARWLEPRRTAARSLERWQRTRPGLTADDLMALGVPRGEALGRVLRELRRGRFERNLTSKAAERAAVLRFLEREGSE